MIENFDIRNLDTIEENINKNVNTKSLILAPFNTSVSENEENEYDSEDEREEKMIDINNPDLKILNGVIKYVAKVRDLNRNYELNNNQEIDNGVVITPNDSEEKEKKNENNFGNSSYNFNNKFKSRHISPPNELNDYNENNGNNEINENALDMLQNLGYKKSYVKKYLLKNEFNYATTSYNLICKYCFS